MSQSLGTAHNETIAKLDSVISNTSNKTFTLNTNPTEDISSAQLNQIGKNYTIIGGVDSNTSLTQLNPVKVDGNGILQVKEVGTINFAPANSVNGELTPTQSVNVSNSKITSGNDVISAGGNLQQVLIYGKKPDNTLQPLETVGDRLLVDVLELSASGRITTSSALSSVQVCGFDTTSARFKTLLTDGDGRLETNSVGKTSTLYSSQSITGNDFWSVELDTSLFNRLNLVINSNATSSIAIYGSNTSGGTFIPLKSDMPLSSPIISGNANLLTFDLVAPPKFIKVANADAGGIVIDVLATLSN